MKYDEPDVREAYRRGARDGLDILADRLTQRQLSQIEAWLEELEVWQDSDPPPGPVLR